MAFKLNSKQEANFLLQLNLSKYSVFFQTQSSDRINTTKQGLPLTSTLIHSLHPLTNYLQITFLYQLIANNQLLFEHKSFYCTKYIN